MRKAVGIEVRRLSNLLAREVTKIDRDFINDSITEMHANVMDYLLEAGEQGVMQKDIEQAFTIRKSTASRILKLMEKKGIIERHGVDYDARLKRIVLTPAAAAKHELLRAHAEAMERRITAGVSKADLETFFTVIEKMQHNLEE